MDINAALRIDMDVLEHAGRADHIRSVAFRTGLYLAHKGKEPVGDCCVDFNYFLGQAFVSLLIVAQPFQKMGFGFALLEHVERLLDGDLWTSTNLTNGPMISLLLGRGYRACGQLDGLDDRDPELFFKKSKRGAKVNFQQV
ncbi:GNAT family N-acetyltransferase [uncultured Cohaesibacter sp.]|uniref:GNAT family N-acetyltransferase n=1 Tax=uncultured Cohaesibacter sp. TaxID=1002546 RepID=UPI00292DFB35|nr:GNAT family N-acetyltransferase [uncultured Cohaesibacter sp.]